MTRVCTVCTHKSTRKIDKALATREGSYRDISRRFGVSKDALGRHLHEHLPETLARGHEAAEAARADELLRQVRGLQEKTLDLLLKAESAGDLRTALSGIREARSNIELLARLEGQIAERPSVVVNNAIFMAAPVREAIARALRPYPLAGYAVSDALGELEEGRG